MIPVVFIVGFEPTQVAYDNLMTKSHPYNVHDFWTSHLPPFAPFLVTQWNLGTADQPSKVSVVKTPENAVAIKSLITSKFGTQKVKLGGHSYGADMALKVAAIMPGQIDYGFYIDPVEIARWNLPGPNQTGLTLPPTVPLADCWYRESPSDGVWSTFISAAKTNRLGGSAVTLFNTAYPPSQAGNHGWGVWQDSIVRRVGGI